jgi:hypothetical protein
MFDQNFWYPVHLQKMSSPKEHLCDNFIAKDLNLGPECLWHHNEFFLHINFSWIIYFYFQEAENSRTQAIDLQWMVMACDPNSVERETCDELPVISTIIIFI